ncbi:hypothetical protein WMF18_12945 [Sorangium sp. So ce315]|uniref:hypothetical protein n=1 Tax=Sorangium sp. So ce315 TaxID=3133299 RepID=UPI003F613E4B
MIEATGREHASGLADVQRDQNDLPIQALPHANDALALRNYIEEYFYDVVGNIVRIKQPAGAGTWIRRYSYEMTSSRLVSTFGDPDDEPSDEAAEPVAKDGVDDIRPNSQVARSVRGSGRLFDSKVVERSDHSAGEFLGGNVIGSRWRTHESRNPA